METVDIRVATGKSKNNKLSKEFKRSFQEI